jgi:hypothetical protein
VAGDEQVRLYRRAPRVANPSCGDWNGDGVADAADLGPINDAILRKSYCPPRVCDINGDGDLRQSDVQYLARYVRDGAPPLACPH